MKKFLLQSLILCILCVAYSKSIELSQKDQNKTLLELEIEEVKQLINLYESKIE